MHSEPSSQRTILAHNIAFKERKLRLRWLLVISSIPLFAIFTAFGIAPQTVTRDIPVATVIEDIALPKMEGEPLATLDGQTFWQADQIRRDDTLGSLMARLNIRNAEAIDYLSRNPEASALASQLRPGRSIQAQTDANGDLLKLEYHLSSNAVLYIERNGDGDYHAHTAAPALETHNVLKSAEIQSSLFAATDAVDIPDQIAIQMAEIFSSDIDFHSDLRQGDRFVVIYEAGYNNGERVNTGKVLAAEFVNKGNVYRAVLYRNPDGGESYYTPEGKSLHKSFLRSPLEFTRISSGFSLGRYHPILQRMRAHKGVDYAAPTGTRIKASSDGVVAFVGKKGGYGNVIIPQHRNDIRTVYGHLSRFAKGLHRGEKVSQGDIIGYVGMSGLATGPHLHYEFLLHGKHRDPLKVALPTAEPLPRKYKADFLASSASLTAQLNLLSSSNIALLE